ncbi:hypothetical protein ALGA_2521 [Labilibaculum antarcticum]|uniref:Uncharacterized protein n=2 Tax=Labilibaculum antarcticum TaxID=1717717 RepID=A0A1Y1CLB2_9BACT|nr:hypothetical protein ALGA_2521 [Labilibaculum antarcticum]
MKESKDQYDAAYTNSPSVFRMPIILFPLRVVFTLLCIASGFLLVSSLFINLGEVVAKNFREAGKTAHSADILILINTILGLIFIFSILVLWLLKLVKVRNRYIRKMDFFWHDRFCEMDEMVKQEEK